MGFWPSILGPRHRFEGGLFLPEHKSVTARRPIEDLPITGLVDVPLRVFRDHTTAVLLSIGDHVKAGQLLARPLDPDSVAVHAPISGVVRDIGTVATPLEGLLPGVRIEPGDDVAGLSPSTRWEGVSFIDQLADRGVVCGRHRTSAHVVIRDAMHCGVTNLIINAMETEPYLTTELRLLVEQPGRLIDATCEIADAIGARRVLFALPFRHRRMVRTISAEAAGRNIEVVPLANKYPQCHPIVLTNTLLGVRIPPDGTERDVGALVLQAATVLAIADAVLDDRPTTDVVMTVSGNAVDRPGTYRVPVGTPIRRLAEAVEVIEPAGAIIAGGPLTGVAIDRDDAVVTADTTAILFLADSARPEPIACIHCGWCVEDCPVGLEPAGLAQLEGRDRCSPDDAIQLAACVDCGLCAHVCPSQLPLSTTIRSARSRFVAAANGGPSGGAAHAE